MSTSAPSQIRPAQQFASSHPTTLALAPYALSAVLVISATVLLALGAIGQTAGVALLAAVFGGHLAANLGPGT